MSESKNKPAGLMVQIKSWENDGDSYNTVTLWGLQPQTVHALVPFLELFHSRNYRDDKVNLGNSEIGENDDLMQGALAKALKADSRFVQNIMPQWGYEFDGVDVDLAVVGDIVSELIGIWCEGERYRVFESIKVLRVPEEIVDVTPLYTVFTRE